MAGEQSMPLLGSLQSLRVQKPASWCETPFAEPSNKMLFELFPIFISRDKQNMVVNFRAKMSPVLVYSLTIYKIQPHVLT